MERLSNQLPLHLRESSFAVYSLQEVCHYLSYLPDYMETKMGPELLAASIMSRLRVPDSAEPHVAYMLSSKGISLFHGTRPTLEQLAQNPVVEDSDTDIYLWQADRELIKPLQVTRLEARNEGDTIAEKLNNRVKKKCNTRGDPHLELVILAHIEGEVEAQALHYQLQTIQVPFTRICVAGQFGDRPEPGTYDCMELYPEFLKLAKVVLELP